MRKWNDTWKKIAEETVWNDHIITDDLLKEVLMKIYYNNYKGIIAKEDSVCREIKERKLIKTILYGDYIPHGVLYCVQGSPPKGSIYITHIDYESGCYFYDGKMRSLFTKKYLVVKNLFIRDAKNVIFKWHQENARPKDK